jgi:hypothetical protein
VTRTLRVMAFFGALGVVIYVILDVLYHAAALPLFAFENLLLVANLMLIASWIGTALTYVAGVVAAVAAAQRHQRGWAVALIGVLALQELYPLLARYFPQLITPFRPLVTIAAADGPLVGVILAIPITLLVVVYSLLPSSATASSIAPAGSHTDETPRG